VSRLVSIKQDEIMESILKSDVICGFDNRFRDIRDAIGEINDMRLTLKDNEPIDNRPFLSYHNHPFYSAYRHLTNLVRYLHYIRTSGSLDFIGYRFERLLKEIVSLSRITRNLLHVLNKRNVDWQTGRSKYLLSSICKTIESFINDFSLYIETLPEYNDCRDRISKDLIKIRSLIDRNDAVKPKDSTG